MENYLTVCGIAEGEYEEKRSKFIARVYHAESEAEAAEIIAEVRKQNPGARHVVSAYRLNGGYERFSDDGEPSGTGGKPLLEMLTHKGLTDTLAVVVRYFGGVLLGVGGLKRAYTAAADAAISKAETAMKLPAEEIVFTVGYGYYEKTASAAENMGGEITDKQFSDDVSVSAVIPLDAADEFINFLTEYTKGKAIISGKKEILYNFSEKKSDL